MVQAACALWPTLRKASAEARDLATADWAQNCPRPEGTAGVGADSAWRDYLQFAISKGHVNASAVRAAKQRPMQANLSRVASWAKWGENWDEEVRKAVDVLVRPPPAAAPSSLKGRAGTRRSSGHAHGDYMYGGSSRGDGALEARLCNHSVLYRHFVRSPVQEVRAALRFIGLDASRWRCWLKHDSARGNFEHVPFRECQSFSNWRTICRAFTTHAHGYGTPHHQHWKWMLEDVIGTGCSCNRTLHPGPGVDSSAEMETAEPKVAELSLSESIEQLRQMEANIFGRSESSVDRDRDGKPLVQRVEAIEAVLRVDASTKAIGIAERIARAHGVCI